MTCIHTEASSNTEARSLPRVLENCIATKQLLNSLTSHMYHPPATYYSRERKQSPKFGRSSYDPSLLRSEVSQMWHWITAGLALLGVTCMRWQLYSLPASEIYIRALSAHLHKSWNWARWFKPLSQDASY